MSAFYRFGSSLSKPLGLGVACGAIFGVALLASTMKPRLPINIKHRRPMFRNLRSWISAPNNTSSFSGVLDLLLQYRSHGRTIYGSTKGMPIVASHAPPPQDSLLFQGATFDEPETEKQNEFPNYPLSPLPMFQFVTSPQSSLLFHEAIFTCPTPVILTQIPLPLLSPLELSFSAYYASYAAEPPAPTESDFGLAGDVTTHDNLQSISKPLLFEDTDLLVSPGVVASVADEMMPNRQNIPAIIPGFGATLTICEGGVEDHLMTTFSDLSKKASDDQSSLTLLVVFEGNASSASRITQYIIDHLKEHLDCLAVYMPQRDHSNAGSAPSVELSQLTLAPTELSILQCLVWRGNVISDLFSQWGSSSNIPFRTLRTLSLTCGLSLEDCIQVLFQCDNLMEFSAQSLGVFASSMKHDFHNKDMAQLKALTIKSTVPLEKLFKTLKMLQLNTIDLQPGPNSSFSMRVTNFGIPWGTLRSVKIVGIPDESDLIQVKEQCRIAQHLHLEILKRDG